MSVVAVVVVGSGGVEGEGGEGGGGGLVEEEELAAWHAPLFTTWLFCVCASTCHVYGWVAGGVGVSEHDVMGWTAPLFQIRLGIGLGLDNAKIRTHDSQPTKKNMPATSKARAFPVSRWGLCMWSVQSCVLGT